MSTEYEYVVRDDRTSSKSNCPDTNNGTVGGSKLAWGGGTLYPQKTFIIWVNLLAINPLQIVYGSSHSKVVS